ncbi:MAG TPA: hypothetical protein VGO50_05000 [Pyrinomonadaceae bacterium]|jgi:uncharacterized delta-60 repeat protein|nr:hypothetical protein [Pyrinomonadaceae bacterium]
MKNLFRCLLVICLFSVAGVTAQTTLDFANIVSAGSLAYVKDIAVQPDNKIIMFAPCSGINTGNVPFCGIRINEDGSFDPSFANSQFGVLSSPNGATSVSDVEVQNDGKVVAIGGGTGAVLVRYNADGSLDPIFGTGGTVLTIVDGGTTTASKAAIQPDGKIVIVGTAPGGQLVARYLPDGTLDNSFGTGGIVQTNEPGSSFSGVSVALQVDGKIVVGGNNSTGLAYLVTRYNSDGSLDTSWDGDGIKSIPYTAGAANNGFAAVGIRAIAVKLDGRIVALGHKNILFQFNSDGSEDTTFDGDGARQALNGNDKDPYSLAVSASGRITVVGATYGYISSCGPFPTGPCPSPILYYLVSRFNADGTPDTTLYGVGYANIYPGAAAGATAVALDSRGRTVVSGIAAVGSQTFNPWNTPLFSAARISAPPSVGPVGLSGRVTRPDGAPVGSAVLILQSGSTAMTALTNPFGYYSFQNVPSGAAYAISPGSKKVMFADRNVFVDGNITAFNITSEPAADARLGPVKIGPLTK